MNPFLERLPLLVTLLASFLWLRNRARVTPPERKDRKATLGIYGILPALLYLEGLGVQRLREQGFATGLLLSWAEAIIMPLSVVLVGWFILSGAKPEK